MSGHSKWNNIKRTKEKSDAQKGKIFTKIGREIAVAVKQGGADPTINPRLQVLITKAKQANMPNDTITRSIKKASGELGNINYEEIIYEGYGVGGSAVIVKCLTDNKNRTAGDVRHAFDKFGGSLGSKAINNAVLSSLSDLTKNFNVVHLCGKDKKQMPNKKYNNYLCQEYVNNIEDYFVWADIVVTRGGANALFELLALKKPMLIIPLPKTESRGDQIDNANYFKSKNYAEVLYQENLNPYNLLYYLNEVDKNSGKLIAKMEKSMNELPNKKIVDTIVKNL